MYPLYIKCRYISIVNDTIYHYYLSENSQFKEYLLGYSYDNLCNTFTSVLYDLVPFLPPGSPRRSKRISPNCFGDEILNSHPAKL